MKKLGLLLVDAAGLPTVFDSIKLQYQLILNFFELDSIGMVLVKVVKDKGDIKNNPALEKAFNPGKCLT